MNYVNTFRRLVLCQLRVRGVLYKTGERKVKKRLICLFVLFVLALSALVVRLAAIQLIEASKYRLLAEGQSSTILPGVSVRGTIFDRNSRPFTGAGEGFLILLEDRKIDEKAESLLREMNARDIESESDKYRVYGVGAVDGEGFKRLYREYGALVLQLPRRYSENQPAMHLIGYVDQQGETGLCGIEKDFDEVLSAGRKVFSVRNDGHGYIIPGVGIQTEGAGRDWGVLTTLDMDVQNIAEKALADSGRSGAVIVTHIPSGEILASASAPGYDPYNIEEHVDNGGEKLLNKATSGAYPFERLFHVIAAAAALEKGVAEPDAESVLEMAIAFGLTEEAVHLLSGQSAGNLLDLAEAVLAGNTSSFTSLKDLLITPMQAARATRIIGSGGRDSKLSVIRGTVEGIRGAEMLPKPQAEQVISMETARAIREMIRESIEKDGEDAFGSQGQSSGENWCTGYVPADDPLYGITVFVENPGFRKESAVSIFNDIADRLHP